jgi:hypothetical protein
LSRRWPLIAVAVIAFLAISVVLARWLSTEGVERDKVHTLLQAQARGDVKIVSYESGTSYALGKATGKTRVAWTSLQQGLVEVQCVTVRRSGSALAGRSVTLLRISAPIDRQGSC